MILVVKPPRTLRKANLITVVSKKPPENCFGEKPSLGVGTEHTIHIVPVVGFEPGSKRWKARKDALCKPDVHR